MISGITPFATTLLFLQFGWVGPAALFAAYSLLGLVAALVTRETWPKATREAVARIVAETPQDAKVPAAH